MRALCTVVLGAALIASVLSFATPALSANEVTKSVFVLDVVPSSHHTVQSSTGTKESEVVNAYEIEGRSNVNVICPTQTNSGHTISGHSCHSVTTCRFAGANVPSSCTFFLTAKTPGGLGVLTASYTNKRDGMITGGTGVFRNAMGTYRSTEFQHPAAPARITFDIACGTRTVPACSVFNP